jgi:hypothetical protein
MEIQLLSDDRKVVDRADSLDEARELALMYVNDPRDAIPVLFLYDVGNQQFRGWVAKGDKARTRAKRRRA